MPTLLRRHGSQPASSIEMALSAAAATTDSYGFRRCRLRPRLRSIDSYSAHADRSEILAWIAARRPIAGSLFLTHGENGALASLEKEVGQLGVSVLTPEIGECYALPTGAPAKRLKTGRIDLRPSLKADWQNDYADFAVNLKRELRRIKGAEARREAIAKMLEVLASYEAHRRDARRHGDHPHGPDRPVRRISARESS